MDSVDGHVSVLSLQNPMSRKEWRALSDGPSRDRLPSDNHQENVRMNGSARAVSNSGLRAENTSSAMRFHPTNSNGSSRDPEYRLSQDGHANGENSKHHDEISDVHEDNPTSNNQLSPKHFNETLEQRLHDVIRQREQLQRLEAELRGQFIARSEILRLQNSFDEKTKQHSAIVFNLQEKLHEKDRRLDEMQQQLEEKERQLHANKREASEAVNQVWAKDGLLREQTNELATLRHERENLLVEQKAARAEFDAERGQLLAQLHDMENQLHEKERQLQELDEQHRAVQETLLYKDQQWKECQAWIQRAQELDAFHANTNSSLHAELRDRTEQMNQLWLGQQRQLAEMERFHMQTIQRLRAEVAEVREQNNLLRNGTLDDIESKNELPGNTNNKDVQEMNLTDPTVGSTSKMPLINNQEYSSGIPIAGSRSVESAVAAAIIPGSQAAEPVVPAPIIPGNPVTVLHDFAGQPPVVAPVAAVHPQIPQSPMNQFPNTVIMQPQQQLPILQVMQHAKLIQLAQPSQIHIPHPQQLQTHNNFLDSKSSISVDTRDVNQQKDMKKSGDSISGGNHDLNSVHTGNVPGTQFPTKSVEKHTGEGILDNKAQKNSQPQRPEENVQQDSEKHGKPGVENKVESRDSTQTKTPSETRDATSMKTPLEKELANAEDQSKLRQGNQNAPNGFLPHVATTKVNGKASGPALLDEKSLLACLVRAIPSEASASIKISTTLPNRLGKMLAPLHWHDYKKRYGRLDEFISSYPELFVIDGDSVHLREGAHALISATTAVAKVAAAAAAPSSISTNWPPTVAVTPVAHSQTQRARKVTNGLSMDADPEFTGTGVRWEGHFSQQHVHQNFSGNSMLAERMASQYQQPGSSFVNGVPKLDGNLLPIGSSKHFPSDGNRLEASRRSSATELAVENSAIYGNRQATRTTGMEGESYQKTGAHQNRVSRLP